MLGAVGVFGLATLVFGVSTQFWVWLVALAVVGAADNISVVIRPTIMQLDTPDELKLFPALAQRAHIDRAGSSGLQS